ncbi:hypothetical protein DFH94DRAFT_849762 [Russula ochroleuca]|uniref:Uncharacterized protein n=1 Tax=Russula ochroleuca TaxID=152965 RepID=A0A9P5N604_9AGAM|nr:hypothetical protein DFH94DRAFT_849762 [Russula ochroleuca]
MAKIWLIGPTVFGPVDAARLELIACTTHSVGFAPFHTRRLTDERNGAPSPYSQCQREFDVAFRGFRHRCQVSTALPTHGFRVHMITLAHNVASIFGGCDDKGCFKDINIETIHWIHLEMQGDLPPPCRAHSATLVGRKIVIIGG